MGCTICTVSAGTAGRTLPRVHSDEHRHFASTPCRVQASTLRAQAGNSPPLRKERQPLAGGR